MAQQVLWLFVPQKIKVQIKKNGFMVFHFDLIWI